MSSKFWKLRRELREKSVDLKLTDEARIEASIRLQKLPRDTSPSRVKTACGPPKQMFDW